MRSFDTLCNKITDLITISSKQFWKAQCLYFFRTNFKYSSEPSRLIQVEILFNACRIGSEKNKTRITDQLFSTFSSNDMRSLTVSFIRKQFCGQAHSNALVRIKTHLRSYLQLLASRRQCKVNPKKTNSAEKFSSLLKHSVYLVSAVEVGWK